MNQDRFIEEVMRRAGFQQPAMASLAIDATLEVLGQRLDKAAARELVEQLPIGTGQALARGPHGDCFDLDELYHRVSRREGVRLGFAVEHVQVVCQIVAETLEEDVRARLQQRLPSDVAGLFTPRTKLPPPPRPLRTKPSTVSRSTLAAGRPGSRTA